MGNPTPGLARANLRLLPSRGLGSTQPPPWRSPRGLGVKVVPFPIARGRDHSPTCDAAPPGPVRPHITGRTSPFLRVFLEDPNVGLSWRAHTGSIPGGMGDRHFHHRSRRRGRLNPTPPPPVSPSSASSKSPARSPASLLRDQLDPVAERVVDVRPPPRLGIGIRAAPRPRRPRTPRPGRAGRG